MGLNKMNLNFIGSLDMPDSSRFASLTSVQDNCNRNEVELDVLIARGKYPDVVRRVTAGCAPITRGWLFRYMRKLRDSGTIGVRDLAVVNGLLKAAVDNDTIKPYEESMLQKEYAVLVELSSYDQTSASACEYLSIASAIWKLIHLDYVVPSKIWEGLADTIALRKRQGILTLDDWNQLDTLLGSCIIARANADFVAAGDFEALRVSSLRKNKIKDISDSEDAISSESDENGEDSAIALLDAPRAVGRFPDVNHPIEVLLTEPLIAGRLEELDRIEVPGLIKSQDLLEVQGMIKAASSECLLEDSETRRLTSRLKSITEKAEKGRMRKLSQEYIDFTVAIFAMVYSVETESAREWTSIAKKIDAAYQKRAISDGEYNQLVQMFQTYEQEIINAKKHKLFSMSDDLEVCTAKRNVIWRSALIEESKRIAAMHLERQSNIARAFTYKLDCARTGEIIDDNDHSRLMERVRTECYKSYRKQIDDYVDENDGLTSQKRASFKIHIDAEYSVNALMEDEYKLLIRHLDEQPTVKKKQEQSKHGASRVTPIAINSRISSSYQTLATWIDVMIDTDLLVNRHLLSAILSAVDDAASRGEISTFQEDDLKDAILSGRKTVF